MYFTPAWTFEYLAGREGQAVLVKGARGLAPPDQYKISATYSSGYRLTAVCVVMGTKAAAKGRKTAEAILKRYNYVIYQRTLEAPLLKRMPFSLMYFYTS